MFIFYRRLITQELKKYDEDLYNKPRYLVINKIDLIDVANTLLGNFKTAMSGTYQAFDHA